MQNTNMPNNLPTKKAPGQGKKGWLFILIAIIVLAGASVGYKMMDKDSNESALITPANDLVQTRDDGFPDVFYSYLGTIVEIGQQKIVIEAKADSNYLKQDTQLEVLIDEETTFNKITLSTQPIDFEADPPQGLAERTTIGLSDLKVGDKVTVIAYENLKDQTGFTAKKVELMPTR